MDYVTLGRTEIKVCKNGFGAKALIPQKKYFFMRITAELIFLTPHVFTQTVKTKSVMRCRTFVTKYTLPQKPPHKMPMIFGKT